MPKNTLKPILILILELNHQSLVLASVKSYGLFGKSKTDIFITASHIWFETLH